MKEELGVVFGRFQPFHNGHLEHILTPFEECEFVYVGITNPDIRLMNFDEADKKRSLKSSNPFSYFQRHEMIKKTLLDKNISLNRFEIIPFPINFPELILNYSPQNALYYVSTLTNDDNDWNLKKDEILTGLHLRTRIVPNERITSSSEVRKRMRKGENWKTLVPTAVYDYIIKHDLEIGVDENY